MNEQQNDAFQIYKTDKFTKDQPQIFQSQKDQYQKNKQKKNSNHINISSYSDQYLDYFQQVQSATSMQVLKCCLDHQKLNQYKLTVINQNGWDNKLSSYEQAFVTLINLQRGGSVATYQIVIGNLRLVLKLLNLDQTAPVQMQIIGEGGFGSIMQLNYRRSDNIICKRINFRSQRQKLIKNNKIEYQVLANSRQIQQILVQYSIYKICSFFGIGPKIQTQLGFDIICFNNCIQFYLQKCIRNYQYLLQYQNQKNLTLRLKYCLRLMHKLKIIHKDIKPDNILYSTSVGDYVISDFGISQTVVQQVGQKSLTFKEGTLYYMSDELKNINKGQKSWVDLYYNDLFGLRISLEQLKKNIKKVEYTKQKLSEVAKRLLGMKICRNGNDNSASFYLGVKCLYKVYKQNKQLQYEQDKIISQIFQSDKKIRKNLQNKLKKQLQKHRINFKIQKIGNKQYLLQFLIRTIGFNSQLDQYLIYIKQKQLIDELKQKIKNIKLIKFNKNIQKMKTLKQQKRLIKFLENQFQYYKQKISKQQSQQNITTNNKSHFQNIQQIFTQLFFLSLKSNNLSYNKTLIKTLNQLLKSKLLQNIIYHYTIYIQIIEQQNNNNQIKQNILLIKNYFNQQQLFTLIQILFQNQKFQKIQILLTILKSSNLNIILYDALLHQKMGLFIQAKLLYQKYIQNCINTYGKQHLMVAQSYQKYAKFLKNQTQYNNSIQYYKKSMIIRKKLRFQNSSQYAQLLSDLASCYLQNKQYQQSIALYHESLNIKIKIFTQQYPQNSRIYNNLALVYNKIGNYKKSLEYNQKALEMRIFAYGQKNRYTSDTYRNIGQVYRKKKQFNTSLQYFKKSLIILEQIYGKFNQQILKVKLNIAECLLILNKKQQTYLLYKQLLQNSILFYKQNHILVAQVYFHIGNYYLQNKQPNPALQNYQKCLQIRLKNYNFYNLQIAINYNKIGLCYYQLKNYDKCIFYLQKSLNIKQIAEDQQQHFIQIYMNLALAYSRVFKFEISIQFETKALNLNIKYFENDKKIRFFNNLNLSVYNIKIQNYKNAINYLIENQQLLKNDQLMNNKQCNMAKIYDKYSELYEQKLQLNNALQYSLKALQIRKQQRNSQYGDNFILIGYYYSKSQQIQKSIQYYKKGLQIYIQIKQAIKCIQCCLSIRQLYQKTNNNKIEQQFIQFHENIQINIFKQNQKIMGKQNMARMYLNRGLIYKKFNKYNKVYIYFKQHIKIMTNIQNNIDHQILQDLAIITYKNKLYYESSYWFQKYINHYYELNSIICQIKNYLKLHKYTKVQQIYNNIIYKYGIQYKTKLLKLIIKIIDSKQCQNIQKIQYKFINSKICVLQSYLKLIYGSKKQYISHIQQFDIYSKIKLLKILKSALRVSMTYQLSDSIIQQIKYKINKLRIA